MVLIKCLGEGKDAGEERYFVKKARQDCVL